MDKFVDQLKNRADTMTDEQLVFLFVPEMLAMRKLAEEKDDFDIVRKYDEILSYIRARVELETARIASFPEPRKAIVIPKPEDIINGKAPRDVPNN
jgi:hypothetical protein